MFNKRKIGFFIRLAGVLLLAGLVGCGGGGDGDSASNQDSGDTSKVALFLTDSPAEDFDHIWVEVSRISMLREDGAPVVIYETDNPKQIDLLTLQDEDLLMAVNGEVPVGAYQKVRLTVDRVQGEQAGRKVDFHLASNKIDLNPKGPMDVTAGETLALRLDINAAKSIHMAGPDYSFRPVVFVDAGPMRDPRTCDRRIEGEITELLYEDSDDETVTGFRMTPYFAMHELEISFQDDVTIFGEDGLPTDPEDLEEGQMVSISGELDTDGDFLADIVIIGEVDHLYGVVDSEVDDQEFTLKQGPHWSNPWFDGNSVSDDDSTTVALSDETLILLGDTKVDSDMIRPGWKASIVGKMDDESDTINAIAVFLTAEQIIGELTDVETTEDGGLLTIQTSMGFPHVHPPVIGPPYPAPIDTKTCHGGGGEEITVFLPDSATIQVKGGEELSLDELMELAECEAQRVQVLVDPTAEPEDGEVQAGALVVWPNMIKIHVDEIDSQDRIITATDGETLHVDRDTSIWLQDGMEQTTIEFGDIESGDVLLVTALEVCDPADYEAVVIVKVPGCEPPDDSDDDDNDDDDNDYDDCRWRLEQVKLMTVDEVEDDTIIGERGKEVEVTEETVYLDLTQSQLDEMELDDIEPGDTLVCHILYNCDNEQGRALMVIRINPDGGFPLPGPGACHLKPTKMEVVVETVSDDAIETTWGQTIVVPDKTPIWSLEQDGIEELDLDDLSPDDRLEIQTVWTCGEVPELKALMIVKPDGDEQPE